MEKVITVETMRLSDAYTIENFIDSKKLMYKAGVGVFKSCNWSGNVAIVCGSGNNAGDGYVLATLLHDIGVDCTLFLLKEKFSEDGRYYFDKCMELSIPYVICDDNTSFKEYNTIVDCIFGTGFSGTARGIAGDIIDKINYSGAYTVAVDINSGLNGDTGFSEKAVVSDLTVSIGYIKTGHILNDADKYIKKLVNCDIDIKLISDYFILTEKNKLTLTPTKSFENIDDCCKFIGRNSDEIKNIVEEVDKYSKNHNIKILLKNNGLYDIYSDCKNTYIYKGE